MGKFVVKKTATGHKFDLLATNGQVIATSEVYNSKDACLNGVNSVIKSSKTAGIENQTKDGYETIKNPKFEVYTDKAGEFRFRLKAINGQIVAVSEGYTTMANCMNGVESVKKNSQDAEIVTE